MLNIGLLVNNISSSEKNYCFFDQLNQLVIDHNVDVKIFYQNLTPSCIPLDVPTMCSAEVYNFNNGYLITTDIDTTLIGIKAPISSRIIYYMDDIEWIRPGKQDYMYNLGVLTNKHINVVSKSNSYADCLMNYAGIYSHVVENYNIKEIIKYGLKRNT